MASAEHKKQMDLLRAEMARIRKERTAANRVFDTREEVVVTQAGLLALKYEEPADPDPDADPPPRRPRRPRRPPTVGDQMLALLGQVPGAPQSWLAEKIYGDQLATGKVSSVLDHLRKEGRIKSAGHGRWEVIDQD